jgi:hypothetical protein
MFDRFIRKMINKSLEDNPPGRVYRAGVNTIRRQDGGFWGRMMEAEFARQLLTDPRFLEYETERAFHDGG